MPRFDYLIVGAGLFGSVFARQMADAGRKCLVVDKRSHIGGNCFTENLGGIDVHRYGPHIFHTNSLRIWNYVRRFAEFHPYRHKVKACCRGQLYSLPINLLTLHQLWGVTTPGEARAKLESVREPVANPANLEQWALSQVGRDIYELFFRGYSQKQWGKHPRDLPASILSRLPIRLNFNDDYFDDNFQGIPIGGYTAIFEKLLGGVDVRLGTDYFANRGHLEALAEKIVYTGQIDRFFDYCRGPLDYRTLRFETQRLAVEDFQGGAIVNYCDADVPFTRITEFKHFQPQGRRPLHTAITHEYPMPWTQMAEPYYPINSSANDAIADEYRRLKPPNVIFGGRLGSYRYYDMHQVIASALAAAEHELADPAHRRPAAGIFHTVTNCAAPSQASSDGHVVANYANGGNLMASEAQANWHTGGDASVACNYLLLGPEGRELARNVILHANGGIYTDMHHLRTRRWSRLPSVPNALLCGGTIWRWSDGHMTTTNLSALPAQRWRTGKLRRRVADSPGAGPGCAELRPQPPVPSDRSKFEIVVAKYREDVAWTQCYPDNTTVYCKDPQDSRFISLPNVGREYGTYLHHIVSRYESLSERTFFVQGDPFFHRPLAFCHYASAQESFKFDPNSRQTMAQAANWGWADQTADGRVKAAFLRLLERRWDITEYRFTWGAQFAVTRDLIRRRPREYYQKLYGISQLPEITLAGRRFDNLHIGFLFEFFWESIFCGQHTPQGAGGKADNQETGRCTN